MKVIFILPMFLITIFSETVDIKVDNLSKIDEIKSRGFIKIGTTGDYRPLTFLEPDTNEYWGFEIDLSKLFAHYLNVNITYIKTSWPTLTEDVLNGTKFDIAFSGITITEDRKKIMSMSNGYLNNGKTFLCRKNESSIYKSLDDINKTEVKVMVNPGGTNEKFVKENLKNAQIIVHDKNEEIPSKIAEGEADIMITEITEAPYYVKNDKRLDAPLINKPFTNGEIGALFNKQDNDILVPLNKFIEKCISNGALNRLKEKYGL